MSPATSASSSKPNPTSQLISRGRRNAPVKKIRQTWTTIAATNTTAVQWWIWRMSRPARTSNDKRITESKAADTTASRSGGYGPS